MNFNGKKVDWSASIISMRTISRRFYSTFAKSLYITLSRVISLYFESFVLSLVLEIKVIKSVTSLSPWGDQSALVSKGDFRSDFPSLVRVYERRNEDS